MCRLLVVIWDTVSCSNYVERLFIVRLYSLLTVFRFALVFRCNCIYRSKITFRTSSDNTFYLLAGHVVVSWNFIWLPSNTIYRKDFLLCIENIFGITSVSHVHFGFHNASKFRQIYMFCFILIFYNLIKWKGIQTSIFILNIYSCLYSTIKFEVSNIIGQFATIILMKRKEKNW